MDVAYIRDNEIIMWEFYSLFMIQKWDEMGVIKASLFGVSLFGVP